MGCCDITRSFFYTLIEKIKVSLTLAEQKSWMLCSCFYKMILFSTEIFNQRSYFNF